MEPTKKRTLVEIVNERIKSYIVENELKPGDRLPSEKELTDKLEVSRTVVRESLKSLQLIGLIIRKSGGGIYFNDPTIKNIVDHVSFQWKDNKARMKELLDTRVILELGAVELAIGHYDLDAITEMQIWNDKMGQQASAKSNPSKEDQEFHRALFKATGNTSYYQLCEILNEFFKIIRLERLNNVESIIETVKEHQEIIDGIRNKNTDEAKQKMRRHLSHLYLYTDK